MSLLDLLPDSEGQSALANRQSYKERLDAERRELRDRPQARLTAKMYESVADWRPPELPQLDGVSEVFLDLETTGLRWWERDRMIGAGLHLPGRGSMYLPIRHRVGPNIPESQFFEWCRRELRDKRIVNIRTKFDSHMFRMDGIDLEAQNNTFGDVAHYAALLDDHRRLFNQADLVKEFLPGEAKVTSAEGYELDPARFADYPAGLVAHRAEGDVHQVFLLQQAMWPELTKQDLHRVRIVEDGIIPVVVEMEHNGAPIDVEMLNRWCIDSEQDIVRILRELEVQHQVHFESPGDREAIARLFHRIGIEHPVDAETGKPTIADDALAAVDHPSIFLLREAMALASLRSKFLLKYQRSLDSHGILRYELHQLPYQDEERGGGAVSGRFSSAAAQYYDENGTRQYAGGNIQQVYGVKSQHNPKKSFNPTKNYIVRKLFKPDTRSNPDAKWFCADMRQIEYRRFVHYSEADRLIDSYKQDPLTDYHVLVHGLVLQLTGKDFERTHVKNLNFMSLYGAGLLKVAFSVGEITEHQWMELRDIQQHKGPKVAAADPRVAKTKQLYDTYHGMFPEVRKLLNLASTLAEQRGYVKTILGRRARFHKGDRLYSALNRVIQGTAADDNKVALIDVHKRRHELGFLPRFTVHDELNGDLQGDNLLPRMAEFLNEQRLESKVPILWDSHCGASWAEAK